MIKNFLIAAALVIASPALGHSQEIFWSFDQAALSSETTGNVGDTGTAYIFSDGEFAFDAADLNLTSSDSAVLLLTGGQTFNDEYETVGGRSFNSSEVTTTGAGVGNLFSVSITENGINPGLNQFNPHFDANVGPNGAILLASVDYSIEGAGDATLGFEVGAQGVLQLPDTLVTPTFGTASLTAEGGAAIPEPSSAALLVLGSLGLVARRKRS
jgi:hypothetical protein